MSPSNTNPAGNPIVCTTTGTMQPTTVGVQLAEVANHRSAGSKRFEQLVTVRLIEGGKSQ